MRVGDTNLWGMEIDVAAAAEEIRNIGKADKGKGVEDVLGSFGLGAFADQLKDLRLSEWTPFQVSSLAKFQILSRESQALSW